MCLTLQQKGTVEPKEETKTRADAPSVYEISQSNMRCKHGFTFRETKAWGKRNFSNTRSQYSR